ncbi:HAD family hydrolase [Kluyvera chengduensis]|uniref:HAD family hydrolase n=1 Tax=Kluyvera sp. 142359 TaxID=3375726 RepID=UPI003775A779
MQKIVKMKKILLVDICGTITDKNTTLDYISFLGKSLGRSKMIMGRLLWKLFRSDKLRKWSLARLSGMTRSEIEMQCELYVKTLPLDLHILDYINKYRNEGYCLYFVSATLDVIASCLMERCKFNGWYASVLAFENDICLGFLEKDLLDKKEILLDEFDSPTAELIMISDNLGDYGLMQKCKKAYAVVRHDKDIKYWEERSINIIKRIE